MDSGSHFSDNIYLVWSFIVTVTDEPRLSYASQFPRGEKPRLGRLWALRALSVALGLVAWFVTQGLIGSRVYHGTIDDGVLILLAPIHTYLLEHMAARNALLISSSAIIDVLALFILARAIFGPTIRPFLGLLLLFALRQIFQAICVLPMPEGMIWPKEGPGFPSLLVTYGVSNDLFFSGHTALAVFGAVELVRWGGRRLIPLGVAIALFEATAVLCLRAHWTMDVYTGAVTALLIAMIASKLAPPVDRMMAKITRSKSDIVKV